MTTDTLNADERNGLDPAQVDALALQLHALHCRPMFSRQPSWDDRHWDGDRAKARFLLLGLRDDGWRLAPTWPPPSAVDRAAALRAEIPQLKAAL
jgi:hypothetical protein